MYEDDSEPPAGVVVVGDAVVVEVVILGFGVRGVVEVYDGGVYKVLSYWGSCVSFEHPWWGLWWYADEWIEDLLA